MTAWRSPLRRFGESYNVILALGCIFRRTPSGPPTAANSSPGTSPARLADRLGDKLFVEHRYTKSLSESILLDALFRLTPKVWLFADYERNIHTGEEIGSGVGIFYQSQCWSLELMYEKEEDDQSIHFVVSLHGLGDIGSGTRGSPHPFRRRGGLVLNMIVVKTPLRISFVGGGLRYQGLLSKNRRKRHLYGHRQIRLRHRQGTFR